MTSARHAVLKAVRTAVERYAQPSGLILVACSGGADSLAVAAALGDVARSPRYHGCRAGAVVVDHGLQRDSAAVAAQAARQCAQLGLDPVAVAHASVSTTTGTGPEAAARAARYEVLTAQADALGATAVFLGHTADDQAETVLLGLARGSGPRALAGMAAQRGIFVRPVLELPRDVVRTAYPHLSAWRDPHNDDERFARTRVRHRALPALEEALGPGIAPALARSAGQVRAEVEAVDAWARELGQAHVVAESDAAVQVNALALRHLPPAVVTRIMRAAAIAAGATPGRITAVHLQAMTALVTDWRGQGAVDLPGAVVAARQSGTVVVGAAPVEPTTSTPSDGSVSA